MNITEVITELIKENLFAGLLVFVLVFFIYHFTRGMDRDKDRYDELKKEVVKIHTGVMFIEDKTKRVEEKINILSENDNNIAKVLIDIKSSIEKVNIIINERIQKRER